MSKEVYWLGEPPAKDDITQQPIVNVFIDGATIFGLWGIMLPKTHKTYGRGLGTGRGQRYERQADGRFKKVEG